MLVLAVQENERQLGLAHVDGIDNLRRQHDRLQRRNILYGRNLHRHHDVAVYHGHRRAIDRHYIVIFGTELPDVVGQCDRRLSQQ